MCVHSSTAIVYAGGFKLRVVIIVVVNNSAEAPL